MWDALRVSVGPVGVGVRDRVDTVGVGLQGLGDRDRVADAVQLTEAEAWGVGVWEGLAEPVRVAVGVALIVPGGVGVVLRVREEVEVRDRVRVAEADRVSDAVRVAVRVGVRLGGAEPEDVRDRGLAVGVGLGLQERVPLAVRVPLESVATGEVWVSVRLRVPGAVPLAVGTEVAVSDRVHDGVEVGLGGDGERLGVAEWDPVGVRVQVLGVRPDPEHETVRERMPLEVAVGVGVAVVAVQVPAVAVAESEGVAVGARLEESDIVKVVFREALPVGESVLGGLIEAERVAPLEGLAVRVGGEAVALAEWVRVVTAETVSDAERVQLAVVLPRPECVGGVRLALMEADSVGRPEAVPVPVPVLVSEHDRVWLGETVDVALALADGTRESEKVREAEPARLCDSLRVAEDRDGLGLWLGVPPAEVEAERVTVSGGDPEGVAVMDGGDGARVRDVSVVERVGVVDGVGPGVALREALEVRVGVTVRLWVVLDVPLDVPVAHSVPVREGDWVLLPLGWSDHERLRVATGLRLLVAEAVGAALTVADTETDAPRDAVALDVAVAERVGVADAGLGVRRALMEGVPDALRLGVKVGDRGVGVQLAAAVADGVADTVGETEAVRECDAVLVHVRLVLLLADGEDVCERTGVVVLLGEREAVAVAVPDADSVRLGVHVALQDKVEPEQVGDAAVRDSDGGEAVIVSDTVRERDGVRWHEREAVGDWLPDAATVGLDAEGLRDRVCVPEPVAERSGLAVRDAVAVGDTEAVRVGGEGVPLPDTVGLALAVVKLTEGEGVSDLVPVRLGVAEPAGERLPVPVPEGVQVCVRLSDAERVRSGVGDAEEEAEHVRLAVRVGLRDRLAEAVGVQEYAGVCEGVRLPERVRLTEGVRVAVCSAERVAVAEGAGDPVPEGVGDCVREAVACDGVAVGVGVREVAEAVRVTVNADPEGVRDVPVGLGEAGEGVALGDRVHDGVRVALELGLGVRVGLCEGWVVGLAVALVERVAVPEAVQVSRGVGVAVPVSDSGGVADAVRVPLEERVREREGVRDGVSVLEPVLDRDSCAVLLRVAVVGERLSVREAGDAVALPVAVRPAEDVGDGVGDGVRVRGVGVAVGVDSVPEGEGEGDAVDAEREPDREAEGVPERGDAVAVAVERDWEGVGVSVVVRDWENVALSVLRVADAEAVRVALGLGVAGGLAVAVPE